MLLISNTDVAFARLSLQVAKTSPCKYLHGCVIAKKRRPLITASNVNKVFRIPNLLKGKLREHRNRDAELRRERSNQIHAECNAILHVGCDLRGCTLYSGRITRHGLPANSAPCDSCWQIISVVGIKDVVYFDDDGEIRKIRV